LLIDAKLSGFEVCKTLKEDPATSRIMILIGLTASANSATSNAEVAAGGRTNFLTKIGQPDRTLVKRVEKHV